VPLPISKSFECKPYTDSRTNLQKNGITVESPADGQPVRLAVDINYTPDGKMANILAGLTSHSGEYWCSKCKVSTSSFRAKPFKDMRSQVRTQVRLHVYD